jgi:hypothetical protein
LISCLQIGRNRCARAMIRPHRRECIRQPPPRLFRRVSGNWHAVDLLPLARKRPAWELEYQGTPLAAAVRSEPWCKEADRLKHAQRTRRMVEFLLKRGAATNLPDDEPWATPLAWARRRGLEDIEAILIKRGAT